MEERLEQEMLNQIKEHCINAVCFIMQLLKLANKV